MKQRLIEMRDFSDPDEAEAARLLRSMPPTAVSEVVERRVYAGVRARKSRGPRLVRLAVLASALLVSTTILSATLARRYFARPAERPSRSTGPASPTVHPKRSMARLEMGPPAGAVSADSLPASPVATDDGTGASTSAAQASTHRDRSKASLAGKRQAVAVGEPRGSVEEPARAEVAVAAPPPEEAVLVMAALRSLRREHNPTQAGALLQTYLARFPKGVLTEEALALGIEAAVARQDARVATALSNQYLGRFPTGRFAGLARKTSSANRP